MPTARSAPMETVGGKTTVHSASASTENPTALQQPVDRAAWTPSKSLGSVAPCVKVNLVDSNESLENVLCWISFYQYILVCCLFPRAWCLLHAVTSCREIYHTAKTHNFGGNVAHLQRESCGFYFTTADMLIWIFYKNIYILIQFTSSLIDIWRSVQWIKLGIRPMIQAYHVWLVMLP